MEAPKVPAAAANAQPNWSVGPTFIPLSLLDSRLEDTARNANPVFVLVKSVWNMTKTRTQLPKAKIEYQESRTLL